MLKCPDWLEYQHFCPTDLVGHLCVRSEFVLSNALLRARLARSFPAHPVSNEVLDPCESSRSRRSPVSTDGNEGVRLISPERPTLNPGPSMPKSFVARVDR